MDDVVFKALSDPGRRALLDALLRQDGQTLGDLEALLPMTRFGVMKHLKLLEADGLVVTRRKGREKLHFLNAVPIRRRCEGWVSKYTDVWTAALSNLKTQRQKTMEVYEIYLKPSPERLWQAITDTEQRKKYTFGAIGTSDFTPGSRYLGVGGESVILEGENLEVDPPRRLVQSFRALWNDEVRREGGSRVTWEISSVGDCCLLRVVHDQLREGANNQLYGGWPLLLSGLKTLLETGELLDTPGSLRWLQGNTELRRHVAHD